MLAMLIAGYMASHRGGGPSTASTGGVGGLLGGLLGGGAPGGAGRLGGLASMLDMNGDGNPLDDVLRMARGGGR